MTGPTKTTTNIPQAKTNNETNGRSTTTPPQATPTNKGINERPKTSSTQPNQTPNGLSAPTPSLSQPSFATFKIHQPIDQLSLDTNAESQAVLKGVKAKIPSKKLEQYDEIYSKLVQDYFKERNPSSSTLLDLKITKSYQSTVQSYAAFKDSTLAYFLYRMGCGDYYGTHLFYSVANALKITLPNDILGSNDKDFLTNVRKWIEANGSLADRHQLSSFDPMYRAESYATKKKDFVEKLVS